MDNLIKMSTKDLDFFYGDFKALHGISLQFNRNQVTALIGPSGCGKSTLLRCLNRMNDLIPYSMVHGEVFLDSENIYDKSIDVVSLRSHGFSKAQSLSKKHL
jgi:phosphate transport system ATP-binding protein